MISLELGDRYSRQVLFRGIGTEGQRRLTASRIVIAGCGATGSASLSIGYDTQVAILVLRMPA